jgi:hypothetical protein
MFRSRVAGRSILGWTHPTARDLVGKCSSHLDPGLEAEIDFAARGYTFSNFTTPVVIDALPGSNPSITFQAVVGSAVTNINTTLPVLIELAEAGITHGDFAPWNILEHENVNVLDWEMWRPTYVPRWDLFTYLYRGHRLLGHGTPEELTEMLYADEGPRAQFDALLGPQGDKSWQDGWIRFLDSSPHEELADTAQFRAQTRGLIT